MLIVVRRYAWGLGSLSQPSKQKSDGRKQLIRVPSTVVPCCSHCQSTGSRDNSIPELLSWETANLGAAQGRRLISVGRNVHVRLLNQIVPLEPPFTFQALCPRTRIGMEVD